MSVIYVLIPLAIVIILVAIGIFFWAVKSDQFNDLDRQGYSILFDEDAQHSKNQSASQRTKPHNSDKPSEHINK